MSYWTVEWRKQRWLPWRASPGLTIRTHPALIKKSTMYP
jgi:hypothetical protein